MTELPPIVTPLPRSPERMVNIPIKHHLPSNINKLLKNLKTPPHVPPESLQTASKPASETPEFKIPKIPELKKPQKFPPLTPIDIPEPDWEVYQILPKTDPRQRIWKVLKEFGTGAAKKYDPSSKEETN